MISAEKIIAIYTIFPLILLFAYFFYTERKRKQFLQQPAEKVFRCAQCGMVYTDDNEVDLSPCPKCGTSNEEVKF